MSLKGLSIPILPLYHSSLCPIPKETKQKIEPLLTPDMPEMGNTFIFKDNGLELRVLVPNRVKHKRTIYVVDKALGKGAKGTVMLGYSLRDNSKVAIKIQKDDDTALFSKNITHEVNNLGLCHRFIGLVEEIVEEKKIAYLLMKYYPGINLLDFLYEINPLISDNQHPEYFLCKKEIDILLVSKLVRLALQEVIRLHGFHLAHRDIKVSNFVIDEQGLSQYENEELLKLVDLELAIRVDKDEEEVHDMPGSPGYVPPEYSEVTKAEDQPKYTQLSDLFALGIVIAEFITKCNYQKLLINQIQTLQRALLTSEEIKRLMPDAFDKDSEAYLLKGHVAETIEYQILKEILVLIDHLTQRKPTDRPNKAFLEKTIKSLSLLEKLASTLPEGATRRRDHRPRSRSSMESRSSPVPPLKTPDLSTGDTSEEALQSPQSPLSDESRKKPSVFRRVSRGISELAMHAKPDGPQTPRSASTPRLWRSQNGSPVESPMGSPTASPESPVGSPPFGSPKPRG